MLRGDSLNVAISAEPQQLEAIEVVVDSGRLVIRADDRGWLRRVDLDDVKVQVSYQALRALQITGSGDAVADAIDSDTFELMVSGSVGASSCVRSRHRGCCESWWIIHNCLKSSLVYVHLH